MAADYARHGGSVIAVETVPHEHTSSYGIVAVDETNRITKIVEKPAPEDAPSDSAVVGRYLLAPEIFDKLETTGRGAGGEIQLTDAISDLLADAPVLLLDEATAALDSESEEAIREALSRLMRGRTVIAIAHRLATLRNFDRVVVLRHGKIIEDGSPERLMQGHGPYRELVTQEMSRLAQAAA